MFSPDNSKSLFDDAAVLENGPSQRDMAMAREIQNRLMRCPASDIADLDCYGECRPAGGIGAEFFDFTAATGPVLRVHLASASDKSLASTMIMTAMQATVRATPVENEESLSSTMRQLNRLIREVAPEEFCAALFAAKIDVRRRRLAYVNAGQAAALVVRYRSEHAIALGADNPVLGLTERMGFRQHTIPFQPGDMLVACSQGALDALELTTRSNIDRVICDVIRDNDVVCATSVADRVLDADEAFNVAGDRSIVVVRFLGPSITLAIEEPARRAMLPEFCPAAS